MENPVITLRAERERLEERIAQINVALATYEEWERSVSKLLASGVPDVPLAINISKHESNEPVENASSSLGSNAIPTPIGEFQEMARAALNQAERPLQRSEIWKILKEQGLVVVSADPPNAIGTRLSRMSDVRNLKGHGFWLADRPYAPASYFPEKPVESTQELDAMGDERKDDEGVGDDLL